MMSILREMMSTLQVEAMLFGRSYMQVLLGRLTCPLTDVVDQRDVCLRTNLVECLGQLRGRVVFEKLSGSVQVAGRRTTLLL
mmetsp:Transcript_62033/g.156618  ORF Transcript_62033/g.156618 Transcript_62033/m.156618 type:complete len:82 (+) Transcript_62033:3050-3295(+)